MVCSRQYFVFVISVLCFSGCSQFRDYSLESIRKARNRHLAKVALFRECPAGLPNAKHFARGFLEGYYDATAGGEECLPILPPERYWTVWYHNPEGHEKIQAWFDGFEKGMQVARLDGMNRWSQIPTSLVKPAAHWYFDHQQPNPPPYQGQPPAPIPLPRLGPPPVPPSPPDSIPQASVRGQNPKRAIPTTLPRGVEKVSMISGSWSKARAAPAMNLVRNPSVDRAGRVTRPAPASVEQKIHRSRVTKPLAPASAMIRLPATRSDMPVRRGG